MDNITQYKKSTFYIHDYETFGKNPALDRPSQFAGIRTDQNFNPIGKADTFFCQLPNDYLPNPEAILLTEINPMHSLNIGVKEYEFAKRIHNIFTAPKTCILGYNNIRFDNEFSRHIFYRNFYDPYSWSWRHENSSWDLLHITKAFYVLRPERIHWPLNKKGLPSFRLQDLTKINNIKHNKSHDALSDVYAVLELAKLMKYTQPKLFNYLYHYRTKKTLKQLINLKTMSPLLYIPLNTFQNRKIVWISPLAWHPKNPNILVVCNLSTNLEMLWTSNTELLQYQLLMPYNHNEKKILELIHINRCPILIPINALRPQDIFRLNINPEYCLNNFKKLQTYTNTIKNTINTIILSNTNNQSTILSNIKFDNIHVDNQLYKKFFNETDLRTINIIRKSPPDTLSKLHINFSDDRLKPLLFYYRARNFPNTLNDYEKNAWLKYRKSLFTQEKLTNYTKQIDDLSYLHQNNTKKIKLLHSLTQYLKYIKMSLKTY